MCQECNVEFTSEACFKRHLIKERKSKSVCDKFLQYKDCQRRFVTASTTKKNHRCNHCYCKNCECQVPVEGHYCFQRVPERSKPCKKIIFFDFESNQETDEHIPNLVVVLAIWRKEQPRKKFAEEMIFVQLSDRGCFPKKTKDTLIAHNMKGDDGMFLLNYLVRNTIKHEQNFSGIENQDH